MSRNVLKGDGDSPKSSMCYDCDTIKKNSRYSRNEFETIL